MTQFAIEAEDEAVFARLKATYRITHELRHVMTRQWNRCIVCGQHVPKNRPTFAGYGFDDKPLLVGACCGNSLKELATHSYCNLRPNLSVEDEQQVWRYMDFAKFVGMLQQRGLFFSRADRLEDRFEGAVGLAKHQADWDRYQLEYFKAAVENPPEGRTGPDLSQEHIDSEANRLLSAFKEQSVGTRSMLLSCWHANTGEAEALWRIYCPPSTAGVVIQSTVGRLWDASARGRGAVVGRVHYLDFRRSFSADGIYRLFFKRMSLSHESEIRILLDNDIGSDAPGKILNCDLDALIQQVIVSPFAPPWFTNVVAGVVERFGYHFETRRSELLDEPFY